MHNEQFIKLIQPLSTQASYEAALKETSKNAEPASPDKRSKRAVGDYSKYWDNGRTITLSFMEHTPDELEYRVERIIRLWDPHHSLALDFVKNRPANIRIHLGGKRNESYLGTDALVAPRDQPTLFVATNPRCSSRRTRIIGHSNAHYCMSLVMRWVCNTNICTHTPESRGTRKRFIPSTRSRRAGAKKKSI